MIVKREKNGKNEKLWGIITNNRKCCGVIFHILRGLEKLLLINTCEVPEGVLERMQ